MIIWGTSGSNKETGSGQFFCPRCNSQQHYRHYEVRRYFTLYFIPLIPMGTQGQFVECTSCAGTFGVDILDYDPEIEQRKTQEAFRRMCVLYLLEINRCTSSAMQALQDIVGDVFNEDVEPEEVATDVQQAQSANPKPERFFKLHGGALADEGKLLLVHSIRKIMDRIGGMSDTERDRLIQLGKATGLRAKHITQVLDADPHEE